MAKPFARIGLFAKQSTNNAAAFNTLLDFLSQHDLELLIESESARISHQSWPTKPREELAKHVDLVMVLGGDGSLLNAARAVVPFDVPILGVNRGRLGFLADIPPHQLELLLTPILAGDYIEEQRFLLEATIEREGQIIAQHKALNDVVLYAGSIARMFEFEVWLDQQLVVQQRSDGLITATPTGSTAYALAAGGPILYPTLKAITLVPMFPHTLSTRPIVVSDESEIELKITANNKVFPKLSLDGQVHLDLEPNDRIFIKKHKHLLRLIHPKHYNYFAVLREKLGWHASTALAEEHKLEVTPLAKI